MNTHFEPDTNHSTRKLLGRARPIGVRIATALALLLTLTGCLKPAAAEQNVAAEQNAAKAVSQEKPLRKIATPAPTATLAPTSTPAPTATPKQTGYPVSIGTRGGEWEFDQVALEVPEGQDIALTFNNNAKTTPHNWILVRGSDDVAAKVNEVGMAAGDAAGYIPTDPRVVAHTAGLVKGGQSETVTFAGLAAGTYSYICTFPGHFELGMKGVLTVK